MRRTTALAIGVASLQILACGSDSPLAPGPPGAGTPRAALVIGYRQPPLGPLPEPPSPGFTGCQHHYAPVHHQVATSWGDRKRLEPADGTTNTARFERAPAGPNLWVRIHDVGVCAADPNRPPIVTRGVTANGVALTRAIEVDGEPALGFALAPDGRVTP